MDISVKIDKLKKALKSPTTPEALKGQLQKQIENLEAQLASETINDTEEIAYRWEINDLARNNKITILKKKGDNTKYYITNENLEKYKSKGIRDVDMMIFIDSKLDKEVVSRLSELKGILPHPKKPKVGDFVKVNISYGNFHYGKITHDYSDEKFYVGHQHGYQVTGIGDLLKVDQFEVISKAEYDKGILPHPKPKKPTVARNVKKVTKKYYAHRDIKSVTVIENGKKVVYKGEDVLNGAQFLAKGGKVEEIATYYPIRAIVEVTLDNGEKVKPANGYHIKNGAKPIAELGAALANEEIINNSIVDYHNPRFAYEDGGLTSGSGDFDYIKFLDYVQPKVAATLLENNVTLLNDYTIVHDGKEFEPVIIYKGIDGKANALSVGYFADNDPQLKLLLSIDFELNEMEYHIRSKGWNINDVDMYAKGGWVKDHKYLNKAEAYEMRYAKGKNRKGYMEKGGEVFDYKNKYSPLNITNSNDVKTFFDYLTNVEKISFHPDDKFEGNMNDSFTKKQAINLDKYMNDCFLIMDLPKNKDKDIYEIALNSQKSFAKGGKLANNYQDQYYGDIWDEIWTEEQKTHFLYDHKNTIGLNEDFYNETTKRTTEKEYSSKGNFTGYKFKNIEEILSKKNHELPKYVKFELEKHIREGQYAKGGQVVGRKAKGVSIKKIADMHNVTEKYLRKQLQRGQKVELEHTTDEAVAYAIAKDHIYENPDYYILLEKIEMKAKGGEVKKEWVVVKPNGYYSLNASSGGGRFLPSLEMAYTYSEEEAKKLAEDLQKTSPKVTIKAVKYGTPLEDDPYDKYAKGGWIGNTIKFTKNDYLKLIEDSSNNYPFYSVKNGKKQLIHNDTDDEIVAKWDEEKQELEIKSNNFSESLNKWLKDNSFLKEEFAKGGLVDWKSSANSIKKVLGVYEVNAPSFKGNIEIVGFEQVDDTYYSLYQPLYGDRIGPKEIHSLDVNSNKINNLDKGLVVIALDQNKNKVKIKRLGNRFSGDFKIGEFKEGGEVSKNAKPKRQGSQIFAKAAEIREPGEKWQEAVRRANLLLKK